MNIQPPRFSQNNINPAGIIPSKFNDQGKNNKNKKQKETDELKTESDNFEFSAFNNVKAQQNTEQDILNRLYSFIINKLKMVLAFLGARM